MTTSCSMTRTVKGLTRTLSSLRISGESSLRVSTKFSCVSDFGSALSKVVVVRNARIPREAGGGGGATFAGACATIDVLPDLSFITMVGGLDKGELEGPRGASGCATVDFLPDLNITMVGELDKGELEVEGPRRSDESAD